MCAEHGERHTARMGCRHVKNLTLCNVALCLHYYLSMYCWYVSVQLGGKQCTDWRGKDHHGTCKGTLPTFV